MTKAALIPLCFLQNIHNFQFSLIHFLNHHLSDPITTANGIRFFPQIDEPDPDLPPVIGIDSAWSIDDTNTVLESKATSRTYLCLKAWRESDGDACGNDSDGTCREDLVPFDRCTQIHARGLRCHVTGQRDV
jgi:hypothetical protein